MREAHHGLDAATRARRRIFFLSAGFSAEAHPFANMSGDIGERGGGLQLRMRNPPPPSGVVTFQAARRGDEGVHFLLFGSPPRAGKADSKTTWRACTRQRPSLPARYVEVGTVPRVVASGLSRDVRTRPAETSDERRCGGGRAPVASTFASGWPVAGDA